MDYILKRSYVIISRHQIRLYLRPNLIARQVRATRRVTLTVNRYTIGKLHYAHTHLFLTLLLSDRLQFHEVAMLTSYADWQ
jgi:hypothetical protein